MKKSKIQKIYQVLDLLKSKTTIDERLELAKKIATELSNNKKKNLITHSSTLTLF